MIPVLVAVTGVAESLVVAALEGAPGVVVVRRCADLAELLAASAAGHGRAALVSTDLHRLDREAVARLTAAGTAVVAVTTGTTARGTPGTTTTGTPTTGTGTTGTGMPGTGTDGGPGGVASAEDARLRALGIDHRVLPHDGSLVLADAVTDAVEELARRAHPGGWTSSALADPSAALAPAPARAGRGGDGGSPAGASPRGATLLLDPPPPGPEEDGGPRPRGRVVAVWGAPGAPGRTTVATTLASELAAAGASTLLVDADTTAASVALTLGLLDESAGLAAACRAAASGVLDVERLLALAPLVRRDLRVLTGLPRAARWPEIGASSLERVLDLARDAASWTVVDCAAGIEHDEELSYDTAAPRRHQATTTALEDADVVLVVGAADPLGLQRLVRSVQELQELLPAVRPAVVVTAVRAGAVGPSPRRQVATTLARYAGIHDPVLVPDDRAACDAALLAGRTLTEAAPSSPARRALADLAAHLVGAGSGAGAGGGVPQRRRRGPWARMQR